MSISDHFEFTSPSDGQKIIGILVAQASESGDSGDASAFDYTVWRDGEAVILPYMEQENVISLGDGGGIYNSLEDLAGSEEIYFIGETEDGAMTLIEGEAILQGRAGGGIEEHNLYFVVSDTLADAEQTFDVADTTEQAIQDDPFFF